MSAGQETPQNYVQLVLSLAWANLAMILVSSVVICAGGTLVLFVGRGITPLSLILWGVVVGPLFGALVAQINEMLRSRSDLPVFSFFSYLHRAWKIGLALGAIPAASAALLLVALDIWAQTKSPLPLVSAAASASVCVLACLTYLVGLPFAFAVPGLAGRKLVLMGLHVASRRPVPILGAIALIVIVFFVSVQFSFALILLLPAPLAVILVAGAWTSAHSLGFVAEATQEHGR